MRGFSLQRVPSLCANFCYFLIISSYSLSSATFTSDEHKIFYDYSRGFLKCPFIFTYKFCIYACYMPLDLCCHWLYWLICPRVAWPPSRGSSPQRTRNCRVATPIPKIFPVSFCGLSPLGNVAGFMDVGQTERHSSKE